MYDQLSRDIAKLWVRIICIIKVPNINFEGFIVVETESAHLSNQAKVQVWFFFN